jgi:phosphoribosylformylglycinamidine (FGAM) synthase PurS component
MKNSHISLIICLLAVLAFSSCRQKTIRTIEKSDVERYYLAAYTSKGALSIELNVEIPVCYDDEKVLDSIRNTIISNLFGLEYTQVENDSLVKRFTTDLKTEYKLTNEPILNEMDEKSLYSFNNEHILDGFSLLSDEHIYSYGINRYVFMGGAHGLNTINYLNFNLKNGKQIRESDLFMKNSIKKLTDLIKRRIVEQSQEDESLEPIKNLEKTDFWTDAIKPNGNFYITDESLNYVFNPYEIGPYYLGITEVRLPYERLKSILKPNSLVSYLIKKENVTTNK